MGMDEPTMVRETSARLGTTYESPVDVEPGVSRAMDRLSMAIDHLSTVIPRFDERLASILVDGGILSSPPQDRPSPPRCNLAGVIENRADNIDDIANALESILGRVDL